MRLPSAGVVCDFAVARRAAAAAVVEIPIPGNTVCAAAAACRACIEPAVEDVSALLEIAASPPAATAPAAAGGSAA